MIITIRNFFYVLLLLCVSQTNFAETIYQWSDSWGHIQYSKTPVSGAMISPVTAAAAGHRTTETGGHVKKKYR
ncbi:DUF4124 domain-containing protein [sulfur-oxidizing endosymbiont of Gigantopelta aegis]|uniref:DUF4124 domain-containing protein n=1 Tax=sulfur-oxidizing endosymbiont of Gigantopelta aegis TaxID=2794934 RepID=UPI0018DCC60B